MERLWLGVKKLETCQKRPVKRQKYNAKMYHVAAYMDTTRAIGMEIAMAQMLFRFTSSLPVGTE